MAQPTPYIGSKISLISKLDIRYEGILYTVDSKESTIALSKVRSFGTEDRNAAHVVPPQDDVYDYIIFKANDIKDLIVCETPKPPAAPGLPYDPAILSVSQKPSAAAPPAPVGSERRSGSENATRTSSSPTITTTTTNVPSQQQPQQSWKNNDNKANNSRQGGGGYQNRQHGYEGNNKPQQPRNYESQNRNDNYRQGNNQQNNRNYDSQNRNNSQNNRGGPRNQNNSRGNGPRPHGGPRNNLKFENDYDFEKAYEQFKETLEAIVGDVQNVKIDDSQENDESTVKSGGGNDETFYDKNKSFFDSISCEALEKEEGKNTRPDWKKERLTNQETFGQQSVRSFGYRRGGFNNRGGGYNNRGGGGYGNRQQGYDNNRRQSGSYDNNRRGGGGGYTRGGGYDNNRGGRGGQQGRDNNSSRQQGENKHN